MPVMAARTLAELRHSGVELTPDEAVAVAQQLVTAVPTTGAPLPRLGPPTLDNVTVSPEGAVECRACGSTLEIAEIGALLDQLLPRGGGKRVPGALRYSIARALQQVDAPPFASLRDLSTALARHEGGERADVVRQLYARAVPAQERPAALAPDRRQRGPSVADLRRQLREADQALFLRSTHRRHFARRHRRRFPRSRRCLLARSHPRPFGRTHHRRRRSRCPRSRGTWSCLSGRNSR